MPFVTRTGVRLAYSEAGVGDPPVVLIHGILCDRSHLVPQLGYLSERFRCVAVDLRGHGDSDAPTGAYSIESFADDIAFIATELGLDRVVVVGHSLGGIIAIACAARYPELVAGVVDLDSVLVPPPDRVARLRRVEQALRDGDHVREIRRLFGDLVGPTASPQLRAHILDTSGRVRRDVAASAWTHAFFDFDTERALRDCAAPLLYLDAGTDNADLATAARVCTRFSHGRTVGAGHFAQLEVPGQVNTMIERFIDVTVGFRPGSHR